MVAVVVAMVGRMIAVWSGSKASLAWNCKKQCRAMRCRAGQCNAVIEDLKPRI